MLLLHAKHRITYQLRVLNVTITYQASYYVSITHNQSTILKLNQTIKYNTTIHKNKQTMTKSKHSSENHSELKIVIDQKSTQNHPIPQPANTSTTSNFISTCSNTCMNELARAMCANSTLRTTVCEFMNGFGVLPGNTHRNTLIRFYDYLKITGDVCCDVGVFYVEKYLWGGCEEGNSSDGNGDDRDGSGKERSANDGNNNADDSKEKGSLVREEEMKSVKKNEERNRNNDRVMKEIKVEEKYKIKDSDRIKHASKKRGDKLGLGKDKQGVINEVYGSNNGKTRDKNRDKNNGKNSGKYSDRCNKNCDKNSEKNNNVNNYVNDGNNSDKTNQINRNNKINNNNKNNKTSKTSKNNINTKNVTNTTNQSKNTNTKQHSNNVSNAVPIRPVVRIRKDDNLLINNKIELYSFIKEHHLEIQPFTNNEIITYFRTITHKHSVTEKLNVIIKTIKDVYVTVGCEKGIERLLTVLIYVLIKSRVKDLCVIAAVVKEYRRCTYQQCSGAPLCTHLKGIHVYVQPCECYVRPILSDSEIEYYLTVFESALLFIKEIEFCKLRISREEYDENILKRIERIV
ncbi:Vacuolar assembly/sorting protein VPS9 [Trachipleistophora hominis]|uniref:Vacuolar assembly/sorting protein VPS9 n=1 Tax=Trachipleistophora hominis TaxID=72359 RepID=L7JWK2_TRAHO|nr:Vacuolar assembly/sorting protein VPS9 [Trachipleistophora hominis]